VSGLYDEDGIDGPFERAMSKATKATKEKTVKKMKKAEIAEAIVKAYALDLGLTEVGHAMAQKVVEAVDKGSQVRMKTDELLALLLSIESAIECPAPEAAPKAKRKKAEEQSVACVTCALEGHETAIDKPEHKVKGGYECDECAWGDTPAIKAAARAAAERQKIADDAAAEKAKAIAATAKKKDGGSQARSGLTDEGLAIVGEGLAIRTEYKGTEYKGTLLPTGEVDMAGKRWSSPFNAYNKGIGAYRNGWQLWKYVDASGVEKPIDGLRHGSKGYGKATTTSGASAATKLGVKVGKKAERIRKAEAQLASMRADLANLTAEHKAALKAEEQALKAEEKAAKAAAKTSAA